MSAQPIEQHRSTRRFASDDGGAYGACTGRYRRRTRLQGEQGYVLAMTALLLLPLCVFVAFAIDAGAWYAQASRMQRAADAAALAAVVWLPNENAANSARDAVAAQNGYTTGITGHKTSDTTYEVSITDNAPRFFSGTFASGPINLSRSATAEFNKPVPLGSPTNKFGNDIDPTKCPQSQPTATSPCGPQPMLWSAIQGPYEVFQNGDPYATKCGRDLTASEAACSSGTYARGATNELYRTTGYDYAIDVKQADVGKPIAFQIYDAGSYPRRKATTATTTGTVTAQVWTGQKRLVRSSGAWSEGDVGASVTGTGIPAGTTIVKWVSTTEVTLSTNATANNSSSRTLTYTTDCNSTLAPFNASPYSGGSWTAQQCQTGDSGYAPLQIQVYDNDNSDLTTNFDTPLTACHLYVPPGQENMATYKNRWVTICTFTPTLKGIYPVRVKSSAITLPNGTELTDHSNGYNAYALKLTGTSLTSRVYALNDMSIWTNTPSSNARFYLAEIGQEHAGKRLILDLYDPGDGSSGQYTMQVLAPPSGSPAVVPTSGTTIPAPNIVDSCRYNPSPSPTREPNNVTAPAGQAATNCQVITKYSTSSSGHYNNSWLRIEIKISSNYTCSADCWWSIKYDFGTGTGALPNDRTVWSIKVVGDPVHLVD